MGVKLIAVDMDGTFLKDTNDYNRERFQALYERMKQKGIKFVVASGNQYYQLKSFFPDIQHEIAFVAENGAYIMDGTNEVFSGNIPPEEVSRVVHFLEQYPPHCLAVCGKKSAYVHRNTPKQYLDLLSIYYHKLQLVDSLHNFDDTIIKFALSYPENTVTDILTAIQTGLGDIITPVSSGHGDIDLIIPGIHKANGIQILQKRWGIKDDETAAFGDAGNDLEMLKHAHYSYAMANAADVVKKAAKYIANSNNEEGVLTALEVLI